MAWGLRGSAALADDAPPFALGAPAPHALLLAEGEGVLKARLADGTLGTDLFGRVGLVVGGRVERHRIEAAARGMLAPGLLHGGGSVPLVTEVGLGVRSASHPRARIGSLCPLGLERKPRGSVQPDSEGTVDNATPSPRWQGCCRPGLWGLTSGFAVSRRAGPRAGARPASRRPAQSPPGRRGGRARRPRAAHEAVELVGREPPADVVD